MAQKPRPSGTGRAAAALATPNLETQLSQAPGGATVWTVSAAATLMSSRWTIRNKVAVGSIPRDDEQIRSMAIHNLKADGVRGVRKALKARRLDLQELELWYCKLSEEQWLLVLNAISGVRTNLLSADRKVIERG